MISKLRFRSTHLLAVALVGVLSACGKSEPAAREAAPPAAAPAAPAPQVAFRVTRIDLGNAIGADKKVTAPSAAFKPADTIYASVLTEGAASNVQLKARWTFEDGQLVNESTQAISPTGPAATDASPPRVNVLDINFSAPRLFRTSITTSVSEPPI